MENLAMNLAKPSCKPGTTLGHEGVGVIEEVGNGVRSFKKGDHVIISCITSDGTCEYCKKQLYSHCENGGRKYLAMLQKKSP